MHLRQLLDPNEKSGAVLIVFLGALFLLALVLDRLSGWPVSFNWTFAAGCPLAAIALRGQSRDVGRFFLCLLLLIAWMMLRDVSGGSDWRAGERTLKAALLTFGLLACARLPQVHWQRVVGLAVVVGSVCLLAYVGPAQLAAALQAPMVMAVGGFVSEMNRNALAIPLGLLGVWGVATLILIPPRLAWIPFAALLVFLTLANGSRNGLGGLAFATLLVVVFLRPRWSVPGLFALLCAGFAAHLAWPSFWLHGGGFLGVRAEIWSAVLRHVPDHLWLGAGSASFARDVVPELPQAFAFAHNAYLDFLLAYGVVGCLLALLAGAALLPLLPRRSDDPRSIWLFASAGFLALFAMFDREHRDPLMLVGVLLLPGLLTALLRVLGGWWRRAPERDEAAA